MWAKLLSFFTHLLTLTEATQENRAEIKEIREELRELSVNVRDLKYEIRALNSDHRHDLEKLALRVENEILRFERRLPPAKPPKEGKS